jgi:hypothetical protein
MKIAYLFTLVLVSTCALAAEPARPTPKPRVVAAAEPSQDVEYADLDKFIGKRVIVRSKLDTTRSGILVKHSASEIYLKLDGGAELSMQADSIKRVSVPIAAPDPLIKAGDPKPTDAKADDKKPVDTKPGDAKATDGKPAASKPADSKAADIKTGDGSAKKN